jgi:hypothetical protein
MIRVRTIGIKLSQFQAVAIKAGTPLPVAFNN